MRTLVSGSVWVHYGQVYVESGQDFPELAECFGGQQNGLCGGSVSGTLFPIRPKPASCAGPLTAGCWPGWPAASPAAEPLPPDAPQQPW